MAISIEVSRLTRVMVRPIKPIIIEPMSESYCGASYRGGGGDISAGDEGGVGYMRVCVVLQVVAGCLGVG